MADEPEKVEEITVRVDDEGSIGDKPEGTAPDASTGDPVAELKAQYDELQAQQKQEQEARQASDIRARQAEERSRAAEEAARAARTEATDSRLSSIEQAIQAASSAAEAAKNEYTAALEAGDWKRAGEAQSKLSRAVAEGVQYEQNKAAWEQAKAQPEPQRPQQPVGDPVEAYINQVAAQTPNSANWLRNHRDWITDSKKNAKLTSAHWSAVGDGLRVDTPEYFAHVEKVIGLIKEETPKGNGADKPAARKTQPAPVAPVTSSPGGTSGGSTEVRLTKGQAQVATDGTHVWNYDDPSGQKRFKKGDPIGIQEMARRVKALRDKGEFERENYEA